MPRKLEYWKVRVSTSVPLVLKEKAMRLGISFSEALAYGLEELIEAREHGTKTSRQKVMKLTALLDAQSKQIALLEKEVAELKEKLQAAGS